MHPSLPFWARRLQVLKEREALVREGLIPHDHGARAAIRDARRVVAFMVREMSQGR